MPEYDFWNYGNNSCKICFSENHLVVKWINIFITDITYASMGKRNGTDDYTKWILHGMTPLRNWQENEYMVISKTMMSPHIRNLAPYNIWSLSLTRRIRFSVILFLLIHMNLHIYLNNPYGINSSFLYLHSINWIYHDMIYDIV